MSCRTKYHRVAEYVFGNGNLICGFAHFKKLLAAASRFGNFRHRLLSHVDYAHEFFERRIGNDKFEHKTVHLRFGERISTVLFDGVLRGENEERFFHFSRNAHDRNRVLLHRFEKRGLRLRRRTVDFVRKNYVAEHGTGLELESRVSVFVFYDYVRTGNVRGHEVGRELNTGERKIEYSAESSYQTGFTYAGNAFEKHVAARYHRYNRTFDDFVLTDDVASDLFENIFALFAELS